VRKWRRRPVIADDSFSKFSGVYFGSFGRSRCNTENKYSASSCHSGSFLIYPSAMRSKRPISGCTKAYDKDFTNVSNCAGENVKSTVDEFRLLSLKVSNGSKMTRSGIGRKELIASMVCPNLFAAKSYMALSIGGLSAGMCGSALTRTSLTKVDVFLGK